MGPNALTLRHRTMLVRHYNVLLIAVVVDLLVTSAGAAVTPLLLLSSLAASSQRSRPFSAYEQSTAILDDLLYFTNVERKKFQCAELEFSTELSRAAQFHAREMAEQGYFSHTGCFDGSSVADRVLSLTNYRYTSVAENLYCRNPDNDPFAAVQGWMNSPGHRKNLLNGGYRDMGLGYAVVGEDHYYVQVFGSPVLSAVVPPADTRAFLLQRTNNVRQRQGLAPLMVSQELSAIAQIHAEDLLGAPQLSEQRRDGTSIFSWRRSPDYEGGGTAASFFRQEPFHDPDHVIQSWLKSTPCYILDRRYTEVGFGYATDTNQHNYVQLFFGAEHGLGPLGNASQLRGPPRSSFPAAGPLERGPRHNIWVR